jgi:hypothetical protein
MRPKPFGNLLTSGFDVRGDSGAAQALKRLLEPPVRIAARFAICPDQQVMRIEVQRLCQRLARILLSP